MEKFESCKYCKKSHLIGYICDSCKEEIIRDSDRIDMQWNEIQYNFCNMKCLFKFVLKEIKKASPRNFLTFGKEK